MTKKHFLFGLNLTAHDTQLITRFFEQRPHWGRREIDIWKGKNKVISLSPDSLTHTDSRTQAHTHPSRASAFLKTLTHPEEWNPEDANTVTLIAHLGGKSWEGEEAIKDAVDAAGWGRERKRLWTPDWSQIGSTIDSTVWHLASGGFPCMQTQKHTLVYSYTHISNLTCINYKHYSYHYNTEIYCICIDTHTQVTARGRQSSSGSGACDDPHTHTVDNVEIYKYKFLKKWSQSPKADIVLM